jgi:CRISPR-associated protein Csm2
MSEEIKMEQFNKKSPGHDNGHRGNDKRRYQAQQAQIPQITLDYTKDNELFNKTAEKLAKLINETKPDTKSTQMRKFYEYILQLNDRAKSESFENILPFVKMLNSKTAYAKSRGHINDVFVEMLKKCIEQVKSKKDLETFKLFFEAVIGFSKK